MGTRSARTDRDDGFTIIEVVTVLAIVAVLATLAVVSFARVKGAAGRRAMAADLYSELAMARSRARATERAQVFVIDAEAGPNGTFGYYHFEDIATPPAIVGPASLSALSAAMTDPPNVPAGYSLRLLESRVSPVNGFYASTDGWDGPPPSPWKVLSPTALDTSGGCTFCANGRGALAFLPGSRAVFSSGNPLGGFLVIAGDAGGQRTGVRTGIGVATSGFVQQVEHP